MEPIRRQGSNHKSLIWWFNFPKRMGTSVSADPRAVRPFPIPAACRMGKTQRVGKTHRTDKTGREGKARRVGPARTIRSQRFWSQ
ncbi:MAG: hypothetical protein B7Y65_01605 [Azorhizobium sp. 35-67-15]|nr:MAG: hypothetical protein B7Y65_01605 [Azorhizobium sp. 35-67-15]